MLTPDTDVQQVDSEAPVKLSPLSSYKGTLSNRVYHSLKDAILTLSYQPWQMMRKRDICEQLDISRSPVSEAITRLAADGLVVVIPQAGTFVARFSMEEIREGAFLREALELAAVELVAKTITDDQIKQLNRNIRVQQALIDDLDIQGFYELDSEMHNLILGFTNYRRLAAMAETSWLQVNRARQLVLPNPNRVADTLAEHKAIVAALQARDPDAAREATKKHLRQLLLHIEAIERDRPDLFEKK